MMVGRWDIFIIAFVIMCLTWFVWAIMIKPIYRRQMYTTHVWDDSYEVAIWLWKLVGVAIIAFTIAIWW